MVNGIHTTSRMSSLVGLVLCKKYVAGDHPGQSDVNFLPVINLNLSDESCIYSTLLFVTQQAQQLEIETPCVTFDQPTVYKSIRNHTSQKPGHNDSLGWLPFTDVFSWRYRNDNGWICLM